MSDPDLIQLPSARRWLIRWDASEREISGSAIVGPGGGDLRVAMIGRLERGAELEALLQTAGQPDADLIRAIWERFGWGGFLRLQGPFAAAIAKDELCLARSATFGAEPAFYLRDVQDGLQFSTSLETVAGGPLDAPGLARWLKHRLWLPRTTTPFTRVTALEPGAALRLGKEKRIDRFWTFTPFGIPRLLAEQEAQAEVEAAIASVLARAEEGAELVAEAPALGMFSRLRALRPIDRKRDFDPAKLKEAYRRIAWPVPLSEAAEVAALLGSSAPLVIDLGMREVMGATETGLGAYVEAISAAFGNAPSPSTLLGVLRAATPVDRRLVRSRLAPSLLDGALRAGQRWKRHLPPAIASRLPIEEPPAPIEDPVTGDRFVDRRFAETLDPGLAARHRAIASVRPVIAPFLDARVIELLFSLPRPHLIHEARIMRVIDGGIPLAPVSRVQLPPYPDDHELRARPRRWVGSFEREADDDRWLGLGAFLSVWERE